MIYYCQRKYYIILGDWVTLIEEINKKCISNYECKERGIRKSEYIEISETFRINIYRPNYDSSQSIE